MANKPKSQKLMEAYILKKWESLQLDFARELFAAGFREVDIYKMSLKDTVKIPLSNMLRDLERGFTK